MTTATGLPDFAQNPVAEAISEYTVNRAELEEACRICLDTLAMTAMPEDISLEFPELFKQLWDMLTQALLKERDFSKYAVGLPRGHGKTIVLKVLILWTILFSERKFILVVAAIKDLAENIVADVVDMLDSQNIREIFGNWRFELEIDRQDFKKFRFRGRNIIIKAIGQGTAVRGIAVKNSRPDFIACDDAQTKECAASVSESLKFISWFLGTLLKAKAPTGCTYLYIGNMYTDLEVKKGLYGCMLRNLQLNKNWISFIVGAILVDGTALWEELHPREQLMEEFAQDTAMGAQDIFYAEVLNDPQAINGQFLDPTKISPFRPEVSVCVGKYIVIDPMSGKKDPKLDDLMIGLFEVHEGMPILVRLSTEQLTPLQVIHLCLGWCQETGCMLICAEAVAYQSTLLFWFGVVCEQLNITGIELQPLLPHGRPKNSRILDMFRSWEAGELGANEETFSLVLGQATRFNPLTKNNKDDILDVMAYSLQVLLEYPASIAISGEYTVVDTGELIEGNMLDHQYQ